MQGHPPVRSRGRRLPAVRRRPGHDRVPGVCELATGTDAAAGAAADSPARDAEPVTGVPDGMDQARAEQAARALAPMRDRVAAAVRDRDPVPGAAARPARHRGAGRAGHSRAVEREAGRADDAGGARRRRAGPVTVDLAAQGPHTVLGGATGAGKSILLQTLVTALLLANRPDELNLVLVDGKGGGTLPAVRELPACHGAHPVRRRDRRRRLRRGRRRPRARLGPRRDEPQGGDPRPLRRRDRHLLACQGVPARAAPAAQAGADLRRVRPLCQTLAGLPEGTREPPRPAAARWACTWCSPPRRRDGRCRPS